MSVALYLRVSTEEQRERQSIQTQREFAEHYCTLHHLTIGATYADDGISGTVPLHHRPEGRRILQDALRHRFDQLLVYKLDRLGRDTRLTLDAVAQLENCGVRVKSMTEEFDTATASGRLMLTLLSGFAAHEREVIRERSLAGSQRVAASGAWMGGLVPYGYRQEGSAAKARLVLSEHLIPNVGVSEAEVVRRIFRMAAVEQQSCRQIAEHLNSLAVPCAYVRDGRCRGPAQQPTSGLWRAGRVRNLLASSIYKGEHAYGKRSRLPQRPIIQQTVPSIVSAEMWQQAQAALQHNLRFGPRNCRRPYLLRGLVKCGLCRLTYIGTTVRSRSGKQEAYYRCNGKHDTRGVFGAHGKRCPSKDLSSVWLEGVLWTEIESFLKEPERVLRKLRERLEEERRNSQRTRVQRDGLQALLEQKGVERDRVLGLYRKGHIEPAVVERQMAEIASEEAVLRGQIEHLALRLEGAEAGAARLDAAAAVLEKLGARLQEPLCWELQRELMETLVEEVRVDSFQQGSTRRASITVTYRLSDTLASTVEFPVRPPGGHSGWVFTSQFRDAGRAKPQRQKEPHIAATSPIATIAGA